jgi:hypothetical protein
MLSTPANKPLLHLKPEYIILQTKLENNLSLVK